MTRKKSRLALYVSRNQCRLKITKMKKVVKSSPSTKRKTAETPRAARASTSKVVSSSPLSFKRKRIVTPFKTVSYLKSPYKSPLYRKTKQSTSGRSLFQEKTNIPSYEYAASAINNEFDSNMFSDQQSTCEGEIYKLLPNAVEILARHGRLYTILLSFFKQLNDGIFPVDNISFQLFCDVVRWYDCEATTQMRYGKETKLFWKLGYRLFGERFVHFMGGPKCHGVNSGGGSFFQRESTINFAVPGPRVLRHFESYDVKGERRPGIYTDVMERLGKALDQKSSCLTFDGKKIKQGLTEESGDVDLLGFEESTTLKQRQNTLQEEISHIEAIQKTIENLNMHQASLPNIPDDKKDSIIETLHTQLQRISKSIYAREEVNRKKEYCKKKLIERGGAEDWRKSKFVYAISAVIAFISDIDKYLNDARDLTEEIARLISCLNESCYVQDEKINLKTHDRYVALSDMSNTEDHANTIFIPQRSEAWRVLRSTSKIIGSTIFEARGCDSLEKQKNHFDKVICGVPLVDILFNAFELTH